MIILLKYEVHIRIKAPITAVKGIKNLCSSPTINLAICGATKPIKPIVPTKETATADNKDTINKTLILKDSTDTPKLFAFSSPSLKIVNVQTFLIKMVKQ